MGRLMRVCVCVCVCVCVWGGGGAAVNLQSDRGRDVVRALASRCDVLVENFVPGKAASLGIGYADLSALNPALV